MADLDDILAPLEGRVGLSEVARVAGVSSSHAYALRRGHHVASPATVARLRFAVSRLQRRQDETGMLAACCWRLTLALAAVALGADPSDAQASDPGQRATADVRWQQASAARQLACYLLNTALGLRQAEVARLAGVTRQAVSLMVAAIEERREDVVFDALVERLDAWLTGEA